jgi:Fe-S cluster assembly iron-binding protein IscA
MHTIVGVITIINMGQLMADAANVPESRYPVVVDDQSVEFVKNSSIDYCAS